MNSLKLQEFQALMLAQDVPREHMAVVCPLCRTVQSGVDLIRAGAGATMADVETRLGFSCVGRFTGAQAPRKQPDGKPCNWTLGGLLELHELEVELPDGSKVPTFMPATAAQAQDHQLANAGAPTARS